MEENVFPKEETNGEIVKDIAAAVGKATAFTENPIIPEAIGENIDFKSPAFKVCENTLPEIPSFWTKVKNVLLYEVKVELTPYQQKVEDEINEFLHQEVSFKKIFGFFGFGKNK